MIYGSWAAFVNLDHGTPMALRAGVGQGLYAFASTWLVTATAQQLLARFGYTSAAITLSFVLTFCLMLSLPLLIHTLLGTADILEAIVPGLIWGSGYILLVLRVESRAHKRRGQA